MKLSLLAIPALFFTSLLKAQLTPFPIWKEDAKLAGYTLPKAVGLSLSYMGIDQSINVDAINLKGLGGLEQVIEMEAGAGSQVTDVLTLRADLWLFPFLNFYALASQLKGYSTTDVTLRFNIPLIPIPAQQIENFRLDLSGNTLGAGVVVAGGYQQWFSLVDASYTKTHLTVIEGSIAALVVSPRFGYDFKAQGYPFRVWFGGMYQSVEQELKGALTSLELLPNAAAILPSSAGFEVNQRLTTAWNTLLGAQYEISRDWNLLTELGFGGRKSLFFSLERRF